MSENNMSDIYIKDLLVKSGSTELVEAMNKIHTAVCEELYREIIANPMNIADLTPNQILQRGIVIGKFAILNEMITGFQLEENDIVRTVFNCDNLMKTVFNSVGQLLTAMERSEELRSFIKSKFVNEVN